MWYSRISKLATSSISKRFTYKNHPTLNQNASFSSLVGLKSQISSKCGYTNYPKNLCLVKHYHNSGVRKWYNNILGTSKKPSSPEGRIEFYDRIIYFLFFVLDSLEKIPYTNRTHVVVAPPRWDKMYGDFMFESVDLSTTLSEEHPDSVRVKMIGERIIEALERDLKAMNNQNIRVDHLVGFIWKFIVVDDPSVDAYSIPGGKIFVNTGMLKKLESDAEIATVIGHEVGHNVARHLANRNNMGMLVSTTSVLFGMAESKMKMVDHNPHGVSKWGRVLFQYPRWRRQESEADDIGLLLMASAGYDPRAAPKVYEIIDNESSPGSDFYYDHPCGKNRAKRLASGKVMKEAKSMYSKVIETRKIDLKDS